MVFHTMLWQRISAPPIEQNDEPVTEDMIVDEECPVADEWFAKGERLSTPKIVDLTEVRTKRLLRQFADLN